MMQLYTMGHVIDKVHMRFGPRYSRVGEDIMCRHLLLKETTKGKWLVAPQISIHILFSSYYRRTFKKKNCYINFLVN